MNQPDRCETAGEPLALGLLLTADQRRTVTVNDQLHFQRCISTDERGVDEIDRDFDKNFDDMIEVPWPEISPPSRRKDSEVNRMLSILDNLPTGKDAK